MDVVAPHLAWPELERRARLELATFRPPHQPDANACCRLWRWFSLGTHVTWAIFKLDDGDYVVRGRWDRQEAAARIGFREGVPVPAAELQPCVFLHTLRVPVGLVDRMLASLRLHLNVTASASAGVDGTEYGFEIAEGNQLRRVVWWERSIHESTADTFESFATRLDNLFEEPSYDRCQPR